MTEISDKSGVCPLYPSMAVLLKYCTRGVTFWHELGEDVIFRGKTFGWMEWTLGTQPFALGEYKIVPHAWGKGLKDLLHPPYVCVCVFAPIFWCKYLCAKIVWAANSPLRQWSPIWTMQFHPQQQYVYSRTSILSTFSQWPKFYFIKNFSFSTMFWFNLRFCQDFLQNFIKKLTF